MHGREQSRFRPNFFCATVLCPSTCEWLHRHHNFPVPWAAFHKIHWRTLHLAVQQLLIDMHTWQWKFVSNCLSVCSQLFKCRHCNLDACPLCSVPNKKAFHMLTYPDAGATTKATTLCSTAIQDHLWGCDTHPDILTPIPKLLVHIRAGMPVRLPARIPADWPEPLFALSTMLSVETPTAGHASAHRNLGSVCLPKGPSHRHALGIHPSVLSLLRLSAAIPCGPHPQRFLHLESP